MYQSLNFFLVDLVFCFSLPSKALHSGMGVDRIHQLTAIDKWFLHKLHKITRLEQQLGSYRG